MICNNSYLAGILRVCEIKDANLLLPYNPFFSMVIYANCLFYIFMNINLTTIE